MYWSINLVSSLHCIQFRRLILSLFFHHLRNMYHKIWNDTNQSFESIPTSIWPLWMLSAYKLHGLAFQPPMKIFQYKEATLVSCSVIDCNKNSPCFTINHLSFLSKGLRLWMHMVNILCQRNITTRLQVPHSIQRRLSYPFNSGRTDFSHSIGNN